MGLSRRSVGRRPPVVRKARGPVLEARLSQLGSPVLRAQLELQAIESELGS